MKKVIIGIHGLANKPDSATLKNWWKRSIREGLYKNLHIENPELNFELVYWADLLYKHPQHNDEAFNFDKLFNTEPYVEAKKSTIKEHKDNVLDDIKAKFLGLFGSGIDALKSRFDLDFMGDWVLEKTMKDLAFYYDDKRKINSRLGHMQVANKVLKNELTNVLKKYHNNEIMLISHSMGTIIAYDVLRDLGQKPDNDVFVKDFVTIGSPLGLPYVKDKIIDKRLYDKMPRKVRTPSIVTDVWKNYADTADPVALDIHLRDDFGPNARAVHVEDDLVKNDYRGLKGKQNHHKSYGYLRTPELSRHIAEFIDQLVTV